MALSEQLDAVEARIVGVLVEKGFTTPENYPLSMNALVSGCNQKSNRFPLMSYTEQTVNEALLRLRLHRIVREMHTAGARVVKFAHLAREVLEVDEKELGVLAELMLRGAQTHGELRQRVKRMAPIESLSELAVILSKLEMRGLVHSVAPAAGSRAGRVTHSLGDERGSGAPTSPPPDVAPAVASPTTTIHVAASPLDAEPSRTPETAPNPLEERIATLETEVARLKERLDDLG